MFECTMSNRFHASKVNALQVFTPTKCVPSDRFHRVRNRNRFKCFFFFLCIMSDMLNTIGQNSTFKLLSLECIISNYHNTVRNYYVLFFTGVGY